MSSEKYTKPAWNYVKTLILAVLFSVGALALTATTWTPNALLKFGFFNAKQTLAQVAGVDTGANDDPDAVLAKLQYVYQLHPNTFYCGCTFQDSVRRVQTEACGYVHSKESLRDGAMDYVVLKQVLPLSPPQCVANGSCSSELLRKWRAANSDLHNYVFAETFVARAAANKPWGYTGQQSDRFGTCYIEISKVVEPAPAIRGFIGRTELYMSTKYGIGLSPDQSELMQRWAHDYPPGPLELERNQRILEIDAPTPPKG